VMTRTRATTSPTGEQVQLTGVRLDGRSVLSAVRAFYLDIAECERSGNSPGAVIK
jgi:hypothetical protein